MAGLQRHRTGDLWSDGLATDQRWQGRLRRVPGLLPARCAELRVLRQVSDRIAASPVAVSAATFQPVTLAAGSIATLFGTDLTGTALVLVDGKGRTYGATIFFSSAGQINFQIPENMPPGGAVIRVVRDGTTRASSAMMVSEVEPGLFTADASGRGLAAGLAVVVDKDGARRIQFLTTPIAIPAGGIVALSLFGTGMRGTGIYESLGHGEGVDGGSAVCGTAGGNSQDWIR